MANIKKKTTEYDYLTELSVSTKYKEDQFYYCGDAFAEACGLPGPILGGINMFLGHSNSGKTNGLILAAVDAQKRGDLVILIITEKKWSWKHAVNFGFQAEQNEEGEWKGDFIYRDNFKTIEDITDFINLVADKQAEGKIPRNIAILWDSVGSIPCRMTYEGKGGKMHNASVLADKIGSGLHSRISDTRKADSPYYLTLIIVNQPWVELPDNPFGQPEIKAKGGNAFWLASSLVFLFGNQKKAGIQHIDATRNGRKLVYATKTRISVLKNHVNGISYKDGKIVAVHNGFIRDGKPYIDQYKKDYAHYWDALLGDTGEIILSGVDKDLDPYDGDEFGFED